MSQAFQLQAEHDDRGVEVLAVFGELDVASAPHFRRGVGALLGSGARRLVVDLRETDFIDSSGIGALVWALLRLEAAGGELSCAGANGMVERAIRLSGLLDQLSLCPTLDEAVAAV